MNEFLFFLRKAATALMLPPVGPLLLSVVGLLLSRRAPRLGRTLAWTGVLALLALSFHPVADALLVAASHTAPLDAKEAAKAQAIVIISGGVRRDAPEYGGDTVGRLSLERVRYGAKVAKETGLPVLVTGGVVHEGRPEAELMKEALEREFAVPVRWTEIESRNTRENAQRSAAMLRAAGVTRIVLVAHAFDIPRARGEFEAAGLAVVPAPTLIPDLRFEWPRSLVPGMSALLGSYYALYELLGDFVRRIGL
ncbi:MAG: YdcF family protein [Burkholderiales bacterium]|nr:YdcF family protein [Burkholderiales bacterium]